MEIGDTRWITPRGDEDEVLTIDLSPVSLRAVFLPFPRPSPPSPLQEWPALSVHLYLLLFFEDSLFGRESTVTNEMRTTERSFSRAVPSVSFSPLVMLPYLAGLERVCCQSMARGTGVRKTCPAVITLQVTIKDFHRASIKIIV